MLRRLAEEKGLAPIAIARIIGLEHPQPVYRWLAGEHMPSVDNLLRLAIIFNVPMEALIRYRIDGRLEE